MRDKIAETMAEAVQHHQAGRLAEAKRFYGRVLAKAPRQADALHLLGVLHGQQGDREESIRLIQRAIAIHPGAAGYHNNLGNVLKDAGRLPEAADAYRQALSLEPGHFAACANLAAILMACGRLGEAITNFQAGAALVDRLPPGARAAAGARVHNDLGVALAKADRLEEAAIALHTALRYGPDYPDAHNNLGLVLTRQGRLEEAIAECRCAIARRPDFAEAYSNLGIALIRMGRSHEAVDAHRKAVQLSPKNVRSYVNLAHALAAVDDADSAVETCQAAIALAPEFDGPHQVLGSLLRDTGRLDESMAAFDRAVALDPTNARTHSGRIFTRHFHAGDTAEELAEDQRLWDERHARALAHVLGPHENNADPERPLRIGYISPDFTNHVLAFLMLPLMVSHDRHHFELYFYSDVAHPHAVTNRFMECATRWSSIVGRSDAEVAEMIRQDRVDILVDLTMHMQDNRLLVFARKPAPVQVTWCYPGSTGLSAIDYRITDPYLDPPGLFERFYSEESVCLPDTFFCYTPLSSLPVGPLPGREGGVTFGCLNNFCKVNDGVIDAWARVLRETAGSRMLVLSPSGRHRERLTAAFADRGVGAGRIEHVSRRPREQYLELYHEIDISLDTFPYNGHTTSLDSLWMGVPVVTLVGETVVGRAGLGELTNLGLTELIAHDVDEFVRIAVALARDRDRLAGLRATLRERMQASPLMDGPRFARHMETAYRSMWRSWCERRSAV